MRVMEKSRAFNVTFLSNKELLVSGPGLTATIDWTQKRHAARYQVRLTTSKTGPFSGLMGNLISIPYARLKKLARRGKKFATWVCRAEPTVFSTAVYNKKSEKVFCPQSTESQAGHSEFWKILDSNANCKVHGSFLECEKENLSGE
ncbi:hypothetical protein PoB_006943400 [Plakobranchus ocellatus]|uniref:Uncharacterized protein n=1 Tax=Plakobranchus ocellatus TaxID=259542 RepID=A0AAV4DFP3_9GAST|nr:hypothetical protein PoB_006943400 [Plakobranchus ocellatus]